MFEVCMNGNPQSFQDQADILFGSLGSEPKAPPLLEAALKYASWGWPVFPLWWPENGKCACGKGDCQHPGKHPIGKLAPHGRNSATTDPEIIKGWWGEYPQANIGIITGQQSGLVVVDVDPRNGGDESKKKLERLGNFPITPTAFTGGGGEHIFLQHPSNGQKIKSKSRLGEYSGVDQKGDGGYVVAPPSLHVSGEKYSWKINPDKTSLAKTPEWLLALLLKDGEPDRNAKAQDGQKIEAGHRNNTLCSLAGTMRRQGMTQEAIEAALLAENERRCDPPLSESEVLNIAKSVGRYEPAPNCEPDDRSRKHNFTLVKASSVVSEPTNEATWVWEGILPEGGMSLLAAKPKVGKTTLAIALSVAIARGEDFLDKKTTKTPVVYLALEEKRQEVKKKLTALSVGDEEPIFFHFGLAPAKGISEIDDLVAETGAGLLVVDTMQKLARVKDLNDYALVTNTLEPLLGVARTRNCHIMLCHHAGKADRNDGDEILGSTALLGAVDTAMLLKKREQGRTFSTIQRYGEDVPETLLVLNKDCSVSMGGTLEESKKRDIFDQIRSLLESHPGSTETEIVEQINCRKADGASALRWALNQNPPLVERQGGGKKGDPYRYKILPPLPPAYTREGENQNIENWLTHQNNSINSPSQDMPQNQHRDRKPGVRILPQSPNNQIAKSGATVSNGLPLLDLMGGKEVEL